MGSLPPAPVLRRGAADVGGAAEAAQRGPLARHAARLLLLSAAGARLPSLLPTPYVRPLVGWQDVESRAREAAPLPDEVTVLLNASLSALAEVAGDARSSPLLPPDPEQTPPAHVKSPGRQPPGAGAEEAGDAGALQREIQSEVQRHVSGRDVGRADTVPTEPGAGGDGSSSAHASQSTVTSLTRFTDRQGSVWRRSDKLLGKGSFGEVWLGMSEDGALIAMKLLRLGIRDKAPGSHPFSMSTSPPPTLEQQHDAAMLQSVPSSGAHGAGAAGLHDTAAGQSEGTAAPTAVSAAFADTSGSFITCSWTPQQLQGGAQTTSGAVVDPATVMGMVEEVLKEVNLLSTLRHDNIVSYLSSAVVAGHVVICMEYVPGGSLQSVLGQFGMLSLSSVRRYTKDILRGLHSLHSEGVVHRDFKPGNVLLQVDGLCKLADFGASAALGDATGQKVVGTLLYMAPEACRGEACAASDCWGVGIAVVQMITGHVPYDTRGIDPQSLLYQLAHCLMPWAVVSRAEDARAFCTLCMHTDHTERPNAEELMLHAFLNV